MGVTEQQRPTPEIQNQQPLVPKTMPTQQMNTSGLPVHHIVASLIQAPLAKAQSLTGGTTQDTTQQRKKYKGRTYFKVSEGDKIRTKKSFGLKESAGNNHLTKMVQIPIL